MKLRIETMRSEALRYRPALISALIFSPNHASREKVSETIKLFNNTFGRPGFKDIIKSAILLTSAFVETIHHLLSKLTSREGVIRQLAMHRVEYPIQDATAKYKKPVRFSRKVAIL